MRNVWIFNVFLVSNQSLKLMCTYRNMIQFLFFMTSIYTWDPLSHSRTTQKCKWRGYSWLDNMLQNFKGFLLHLRSTFSFTGPPESASEEDTHGSKFCSKNKPIYYTWDPLSHSQDCLKVKVKRILVDRTQLILRSLIMTKNIFSLCLN